ncbi:hypothetical protein HFK74_04310|uniref:hypothetical protein n=1 Tax=Pseudomonas sp. SbOxS1 TaxID=2723884 RepID=UPI0015D45C7A|nr:hypothetical protein [Pseudomonas sp. SbOxS1]NYU01922.1 hypothetical protein [Pseudomonas sp. SbOxS1]
MTVAWQTVVWATVDAVVIKVVCYSSKYDKTIFIERYGICGAATAVLEKADSDYRER